MIAWFCSDGVLNFEKGLLVLVSHVKLSVQYFIFSMVIEDGFFFLDMTIKLTQMCVQKTPNVWLSLSCIKYLSRN